MGKVVDLQSYMKNTQNIVSRTIAPGMTKEVTSRLVRAKLLGAGIQCTGIVYHANIYIVLIECSLRKRFSLWLDGFKKKLFDTLKAADDKTEELTILYNSSDKRFIKECKKVFEKYPPT